MCLAVCTAIHRLPLNKNTFGIYTGHFNEIGLPVLGQILKTPGNLILTESKNGVKYKQMYTN